MDLSHISVSTLLRVWTVSQPVTRSAYPFQVGEKVRKTYYFASLHSDGKLPVNVMVDTEIHSATIHWTTLSERR